MLPVRTYAPWNSVSLTHSKSNACARAWRTVRSAKISRRVLNTNARMPEGRPWAMRATLTRPSAAAGNS